MTRVRSAEAKSIAVPPKATTSPPAVADMKARQLAKIQDLGQALIDAGFRTLDEQADALGLARSTAWTILKARHKSSGLSAMIIERMLGSSSLPPRARSVIVEYVKEKSFGLYGGSRRQQQRFAVRLSNTIASSSGAEEMQRRGREEMPRVPAPHTAADGAAFALSDIRWPGWMWCSTLPAPLCQGEMEECASVAQVRRSSPELRRVTSTTSDENPADTEGT